jgi:TRAP transporter 4TM/12TM fusion protein
MNILDHIGVGRSRQLSGFARAISIAISLGLAVTFMAVAAGVYIDEAFGLHLFLGGVLILAFLHTTGNALRPTRDSVAGWALALLSAACCGYFLVMHQVHKDRLPVLDPLTQTDLVVSIVLIGLVLEATRRTIGLTLVILVGMFLIYAALGDRLSGAFAHRGMGLPEAIDQLVFTTNGLFGPALEVAAYLVFIFVLFGALLDRFGGADFFHDLANALVGRQVGGPAKVAVVSSGLYGSVSGSPTADVVTTGSFTIPLMIRTGLSRVRAGAIEAAASTGGSILPPVMGSAAFLMADFTGIPYGEIAIAAALPAVLYYICVYLAVSLEAQRSGLAPDPTLVLPSVGEVLRRDWIYLIPLVTIAWGVVALNRPSYAGALACAALLPVLVLRIRPWSEVPKRLVRGLIDGMQRIVVVGVACAVAGLVIGTLSMTDLSGKISSALFTLASGSYALTVFTAIAVIIVLGMGMPVPAVYALSAVLAAPALVELGIPTLAAHLLIVYYAAVSAITPPVAVASFAAASLASANPVAISLLACRIAAVAFVIPVVFISRPEILLVGDPIAIIAAVAFVSLGCLAMTIASEAWYRGQVGHAERIGLGLMSLLLFADRLDLNAGAAIAFLLWLAWRVRRSRTALHTPER